MRRLRTILGAGTTLAAALLGATPAAAQPALAGTTFCFPSSPSDVTSQVSVWTTVHIRNCPWRDGSTMTLPAQTLNSVCQATGETVTDPVYGSNNWWTYVILGENSGWISNIYLRGDAHLNNVPDCASITQH